jgi:hypothetical protein
MNKLLIAICVAASFVSVSAMAQSTAGATQATTQAQSAMSSSGVGGVTGSNNFTIEAPTIPTATRTDVFQHVDSSGTTTLKNTPSVSGPQLTTSNDTCMGSASGSVNGPGFGVGFGTTWTDEHCKNLKMSRELWNKGMKAASIAVDCENVVARRALEMTGTLCPQSMTAEQRVQAYGPNASAEGAVAVPVVASVVPAAAAKPQVMASASTGEIVYTGSGYTGTDKFQAQRRNGNLNIK